MKRYLKVAFLALTAVFLVACANSKATKTTTSEAGQVRLIVKEDTNTLDEKVGFKQNDTVMDVLKANYKVKEKDGFITSIDGVSQDKKAGKYWMFDVNDKLAPKAADQIKVKDGDKIKFYQEVHKN